MGGKVDHSRTNARDRVRNRGAENIRDMGLPGGLTPPRQRPSKADMRAELAAATDRITRRITCRCGHSADVPIPAAKAGARRKCSQCGEVAG